MKRAHLTIAMWLGNAALLVAVCVILWNVQAGARADRAERDAIVANMQTRLPRIEWQADKFSDGFNVDGTRLSPTERPTEPGTEITVPEQIVEPKTDEQLHAELETLLNRRFALMRLMLANDDALHSVALVNAGGRSLVWYEGMDLSVDYADSRTPALRALALDVRVISIDATGVWLDAASLEQPDKRFRVQLTIDDTRA